MKYSLDFPLFPLQIANPFYWSFCLLLYCFDPWPSSLWEWFGGVHDTPCRPPSFPVPSQLFPSFSARFSSSTRVVCNLSRPQVPSYVRRVSLLVRIQLETVESLFPQFSSSARANLSPNSSFPRFRSRA